ncbi:VOC family protein [Rhizobium sp. CFBP 8762]|uniref:VOC family protein n=1 Tax=Rhizobium sp. CFBP 8762 TaxID=2775279 RepID=UPI00177AF3AA|nr:VOC family protein [Rhizobium sp. CFBP 8762]MBD8553239.1 VOC family protein [Rhizobium sp. CFBP 8762]
MAQQVFINLPVKDLQRSIAFFGSLGFAFNPVFTDETATCMIVSDTIYVMLLTEDKFQQFTPKAVCDTAHSAEVLICLSCDSREDVDSMVATALHNGGAPAQPAKDFGFMYQGSFLDPDGHGWELIWMNQDAQTG